MLDGKGWYFFGRKVESHGPDELRRWIAGSSPVNPPELETVTTQIAQKTSGLRMENHGVTAGVSGPLRAGARA
jgi:hypothetical protein